MKNKRFASGVLSAVLVLMMVLMMPVSMISEVSAASENAAIQIPYSFKNVNGNSKSFFKTNYMSVGMGTGYDNAKYKSNNLKVSATIYIPKALVGKKNSDFYMNFYGVLDKDTYGDSDNQDILISKQRVGLVNDGGKVSIFARDEKNLENYISKTKYLSFQSGEGGHADEYVLSIKNMPLSYIFDDEGNVGKVSSFDAYFRGVVLNIYSESNKNSGKMYLDKVQVKSGSKMLCDYTFESEDKLPHDTNVYRNNKNVKGAKIVWL